MKKVGSSLKNLGAIFLGLVLLFLLFLLFSNSTREGFGSPCINGGSCDKSDTTCTVDAGVTCQIDGKGTVFDKSYTLTCKPSGSGANPIRKWWGGGSLAPC
jgi:hypothetical protein